MHAYTDNSRYREFAQKTLEAFAGIAPQYGLFAASYGLAAILFERHPIQVVVTGRAEDPAAQALESAANGAYRFGKAVLRVKPDASLHYLPLALRETLPHLPASEALAVVCAGQSCLPPTREPEKLKEILSVDAVTAAGV